MERLHQLAGQLTDGEIEILTHALDDLASKASEDPEIYTAAQHGTLDELTAVIFLADARRNHPPAAPSPA